nr:reverse transcriptase domain-containing protein [Tanacetum cinerariifolium]
MLCLHLVLHPYLWYEARFKVVLLAGFDEKEVRDFAIAHVISSAAPVVETTIVASPTRLCGLVPYSESDSDSPDEMASPEYITPLPATSPFLFTDSSKDFDPSEASDSSEAPPSQDPYVTTAHSGSLTRVVSPRLDYPPVRAPRHSEAFHRWCATLLSTFYPPTTSESSSRDSSERPLHSSSHSAGPSRKRCRSPNDSIPSSTQVMGSLAPTRVDLLPPHKRDLDVVDGDDVRDHIKVDHRNDREVFEASAKDTIVLEIDPRSVPVADEESKEPAGVDSSSSFSTRDGNVRIVGIETTQRQLEADQLIASGERARMIERIESLRLENLKIRDDRDDLRRKLRRTLDSWLGLDGNGGNRYRNGGNGNGQDKNRNGDGRGDRPVAHECTYQDFMKCQPLNFKGTKGVVGLIRWCEKMETMFHISNCPERYPVKYATCTLLDSALTWWNSHKRTIGTDAVYALSWRELMKLMIEVLQELTMMCTKMVPEEEDRVEKFIRGLPDNIQGNVIAVEATRLQDAVRIANNLMDKKLKGYAMKNAENERRFDTNHRDNHRAQGYYRKDYPKVKNQNSGNKARVPDARGKSYVLGGGDTNPGSNTVTGTFLLNDHHAYMLFDSGADRSFVSNAFSTLLDITHTALDVSYIVKLADGRTSETSTVLRGCTLGLLGHPFNIDLMPIDLGSFDVIIDMDWLATNHAVIVCDEKIVLFVGNLDDDLSISSSLHNLTEDVSDKLSIRTVLPLAAAASQPPWQRPLQPSPVPHHNSRRCLHPLLHYYTTAEHHRDHHQQPAPPLHPPPSSSTATTNASHHRRHHNKAAAFPAAAAAVAGCGRQKGCHRHGGAYKTSEFLFTFSMHGLSAAKPPSGWRPEDGTATTAAPCGVRLVVFSTSGIKAWRQTLILGEIPTISYHSYCPNSQKKMDHQYPTLAKIPVLDTEKFEQWQFRIQQYLQLEHYASWEVFEFGDSYKFMDVDIEKDDLNQKFLASLAPEWLIHTIVWRNSNDLDSMSLDDLNNHLKVYEAEVQKKPNSNSQDMAFISSS